MVELCQIGNQIGTQVKGTKSVDGEVGADGVQGTDGIPVKVQVREVGQLGEVGHRSEMVGGESENAQLGELVKRRDVLKQEGGGSWSEDNDRKEDPTSILL